MNRIDQYPGRGSGSSCRAQKNPANVTAAAASQVIPDGQDPRRGSRRHHDEACDGDGQPDVPGSKGPDGHPPMSVVLQLGRLVHAWDVPPLCAQGHRSDHPMPDRKGTGPPWCRTVPHTRRQAFCGALFIALDRYICCPGLTDHPKKNPDVRNHHGCRHARFVWARQRMDGDQGARRPSQLDAPTTCEPWNVRTLLNHMLLIQRYLVGAVRGDNVALSLSEDPPDLLSEDPISDFEEARAETLRTFGEPGVIKDTGVALSALFGDQLVQGGISRCRQDRTRRCPKVCRKWPTQWLTAALPKSIAKECSSLKSASPQGRLPRRSSWPTRAAIPLEGVMARPATDVSVAADSWVGPTTRRRAARTCRGRTAAGARCLRGQEMELLKRRGG